MNKIQQFCQNWLDAWTGNKPLELIQYYAKECLYVDPANPQGLRGHAEVLPYFTNLLAANPSWDWKINELFPIPTGFILKWKANIPIGDKLIEESGLDIVELEEGKIIRNEVYFDRTNWFKALRK
jgi:hypothetical protein